MSGNPIPEWKWHLRYCVALRSLNFDSELRSDNWCVQIRLVDENGRMIGISKDLWHLRSWMMVSGTEETRPMLVIG